MYGYRIPPHPTPWPVLFVLASLFVWTPAALAHGVLERSVPPPNATLVGPQEQVILWFSEPLDPAFSSVSVLDSTGRPLPGKFTVSNDRRRVAVSVGPLSEGVYTVRWRALWTSDGHITSGFFLFTVGQPAPPGASEPALDPRRLMGSFARWIALVTGLLLVGTHAFHLLVLSPAWGRRSAQKTVSHAADPRRLSPFAAVASLVGVTTEFFLTAAQLLDAPLGTLLAGGTVWPLLIRTKMGWSALVRAGAVLFLLLPFRTPWLRPVAACVLLVGVSLRSHAAGSGLLPVLLDWLHLAAAAALLGGWVSFLYVFLRTAAEERGALVRALLPRLSTLLGASLGVLALTGLYATVLYVPAIRAFLVTPYGRLLLIKLLLACALAALGALNRFLLKPRILASPPERRLAAVTLLFRTVTGEVCLVVLLLLTVALLTDTPPARVRIAGDAPSDQKALTLAGLAGDFQVRLHVAPAKPGRNRFELVVSDPQGEHPSPEARVFLWVTKLDEDLDPEKIPLRPVAPGVYVAEGSQLGLAGWWQIQVVVRRPGRPDVSTIFPLPLGELPLRPSDPVAARFLEEASRAMARYPGWREVQQITDGEGGLVVSWNEFQKPDRQRYRTSTGMESVVIGSVRYLRVGGGRWRRDTLPRPVSVQGPLHRYTGSAEGVVLGRRDPCDLAFCQVVLWEAGPAAFAAWIEERRHRLHTLLMVAPSHYMTLHPISPAARVHVVPPE